MVTNPQGLSMCEVQQLQQDCINQINVYRGGHPFSDGRSRNHGQLTALQSAPTGFAKCMNEKALSDLRYAVHQNRGCGHFTSSLDCGLSIRSGFAENSCCPRQCSSYQQCKDQLLGCLRQMWDEGEIVLDTGSTAWTVATSHYWNMISSSSSTGACGFGFDSQGNMLATQNFY